MEINNLKNIWLKANKDEKSLNKQQLNTLIMSKNNKILRYYTIMLAISAFICLGVMYYLIISIIDRYPDTFFTVINGILFGLTFLSLHFNVKYFFRINARISYTYNLEELLKMKLEWMQKSFENKRYQWVFVLVYFILFSLSIHLWRHNQTFHELLSEEEALYGFMAGFIVGIPFTFFVLYKMNRFHKHKRTLFLENLKELTGE